MMLAPLAFFESPAAHWLSLALLHFVWQGAAIGATAALLMQLLRNARPTLRYAVGLIGLIGMAACPLATLGWLGLSQDLSDAGRVPSPELLLAAELDALPTLSGILQAIEPYFLTFWLMGVALFAGRLLLGIAGTIQLRRNLSPLPASVAALAGPLATKLQLNAARIVFVSREASEALAVGLFRPLVLIPASWISEMPPAVLEAVLAHELAHVARHDLWVNWLQRLLETLLFYHPAVWWLSGRVRVERELCADELAIQLTGKRLEYVEALAHIASERQAQVRPLLAAFLKGEPSMRLLQRVRRLLGQPASESSRLWPAGVVALTVPLALWALAAVSGQDERDEAAKPKLKRERVQIELRDEDAPRIVRDRERGEATDGDKRSTTETRVERYVIARDGEKPREIERRTVTKDGKPVTVVEVGMDEKRGTSSDRRIDELTALVKRLSADVERLHDELAQLRRDESGKPRGDKPRPQEGAREMSLKRKPAVVVREGDRDPKVLGIQVKDDDLNPIVKEKIEAALKERAGEQKEMAKRVQAEVELKLQAARQEVQEAVQRKAEAARKQGEEARKQSDEVRKQAEAVREKTEAARGKINAEIRELEKKLKKLKEGEVSSLDADVAIELEFVPKLNAVLVDQ